MDDYRPATCDYCGNKTWCGLRLKGTRQCPACQVERFFEQVLFPPLGYHLQGWQRKVLRDLYGTLKSNGLRQYRRAYVSVAKQQGKSFMLGGLPIYHQLVETEPQPEAYGVASAKDQAGIVFNAASRLVNANPSLRTRLKVLESTKRIIRRDGGGLYAVLSADGDVQDGKRPSLLLFDELHRFTRKKAKTVRTVLMKGMMSRAPIVGGMETGEPLMIQTTTSGDEHECPLWFSEYEYAQHVLDGSVEDPSYYAAIWQADPKRVEEDDEYWKSREARVAANPSHEDNAGFLSDSSIEEEMKEAVRRPEKKADFIRLNLNVPVVSTGTPIMEMPKWCEAGGEVDLRQWQEYDVERLYRDLRLVDRPCVIGVDLAWTTDFTAMVCLFPPMADDERWKALMFYWLPDGRIDKIERSVKVPLKRWVERGFLTTVPGNAMDVREIEKKIKWAAGMFDVREVTFDPYGMLQVGQRLVDEGHLCVSVRQGYLSFSQPTKKFLELYMNGQLEHCNNPILNWNASCLALLSDGRDNVIPAKPPRDTSTKRIDGISAIITALSRGMVIAEDMTSPARGIILL